MPQKVQTKSEKEKEFVPDWQVIAGLKKTRLDLITASILQLTRAQAEAQRQIKELQAEGSKLLIKADVKTVRVNGARVTRIDGVSSKLDKEALVKAHGMKVLGWLEEATVRTAWTSLKVTPAKDDGEGEGEAE